jgi:hypothetical protein
MMREGRDSWSRALVVRAACAQGRRAVSRLIVSRIVVSRIMVSAGAGAGATCVVVSAVLSASFALQAVMTTSAATRARRFIDVLLVGDLRASCSSGPRIAMLGASGKYSTAPRYSVKSEGTYRSTTNARISALTGEFRCA